MDLLDPTGALLVIMCYFTSAPTFSDIYSNIDAIDVTRVECQMSIRLNLLSEQNSRVSPVVFISFIHQRFHLIVSD